MPEPENKDQQPQETPPGETPAAPAITPEAKRQADVCFERAEQAVGKGNFDYAIRLFLNGLKFNPLDVDRGHKGLHDAAVKKRGSGKGLGLGSMFGQAKGAFSQMIGRGKDAMMDLVGSAAADPHERDDADADHADGAAAGVHRDGRLLRRGGGRGDPQGQTAAEAGLHDAGRDVRVAEEVRGGDPVVGDGQEDRPGRPDHRPAPQEHLGHRLYRRERHRDGPGVAGHPARRQAGAGGGPAERHADARATRRAVRGTEDRLRGQPRERPGDPDAGRLPGQARRDRRRPGPAGPGPGTLEGL